MSLRVLPFAVTVPAGTLKSAPTKTKLSLDNWTVDSLDLEVPPGPTGNVGFYVANNGVPWFPFGKEPWLVWDNVRESWDVYGQPNASGWEVIAYNTGQYEHTITLRFHVSLTEVKEATPLLPPFTFVTTPGAELEVVAL